MRKILVFILLSVVLTSCSYFMAGTWENDEKNWERAYGSKAPKEVKVINSRYWRSPHFSLEYQFYFEIDSCKELESAFIKVDGHDSLRIITPTSRESLIPKFMGDAPKWFAPKALDKYEIWKSDDPLQEKYPNVSTYAYVALNPIKYIDPDGKDIVILRNSAGAGPLGTIGHAAILIGSDKKGWTYISKDGFVGGPLGSQSKYIVKEFKSIEEFSNSPHNLELNSGTHSTKGGESESSFDFATDEKGNKIQRYDKALLIETTQKDGNSTDSYAIDATKVSSRMDYFLTTDDCSDIITKALNSSKDSQGNQVRDGESKFGGLNGERPNRKFNLIEKRNPESKRIDEQLKPSDE